MAKMTPRTLSGFMELLPAPQQQMERIMEALRKTYSLYGFTPLDTPVIEASEVLLAKGGGETEKQIYRFQKGDADIALRFDLTVPLAKYVALHYNDLTFPFRRYQIGKVYRGERAQRGRFREFYQADIDIIGDGKLDILEAAEDLVDDAGDLGLVEDIQLAVTDDVDVGLVELTEAAPLGALAAVDLADLAAAEGEGQVIVVQGNILCQRHGQVKTQSQIAVALLETVDLLLSLAAALGQQNLGIFNHRGIQSSKAVQGIGIPQHLHHTLHLSLLLRQQFHKTGQSPGLDSFHKYFLRL